MPRFTVAVNIKITEKQRAALQETVDKENITFSILIRRYIDDGIAKDKLDNKLISGILKEARERYENERGG